MSLYVAVVPVVSVIALAFVAWLAWDVLRRDSGTPEMQEIASTIREGATAFLKRQYTTIGIMSVITAVVVALAIGLFDRFPEVASYRDRTMELGIITGVAFLVG